MTTRINIDDYWSQATTGEADAFHSARGNSPWAGDDSLKSQALQRAWDFLKSLEWAADSFEEDMPEDVKNAHMAAALEELKEPWVLLPILTADNFLSKKDMAGAIVKEFKSNAPVKKRFLAIEALLRPYVFSSSVNIRMVRG